MQINTKAFTLVEMLVTMAVSTIIIAATYASYDLVSKQYKKNIDIAEMHTSGRAIMQMIERDIRMAGFEYRDKNGKVTYGSIAGPLVIKDSGNKCCDEVTVVYDYVDDVLDWKGRLVSSKVDRIRITYSSGPHPRNQGGGDKYDRYRLYKQKDILGKNNAILAKPITGTKEVMVDFVEDFQLINIETSGLLYVGNSGYSVQVFDPVSKKFLYYIKTQGQRPDGGLAFGPNGLFYVGNSGYSVQVFDPVQKKYLHEIKTQGQRPDGGLAFGPNGLLYVGNSGYSVQVFDPVQKKYLHEIKTQGQRPDGGLAFGPNGLLYVGNSGYSVQVFDPIQKKYLHEIKTQGQRPDGGLAFGPDGNLYVGNSGYSVQVFDPVSKKFLYYIKTQGQRPDGGLAFQIKRTGQESLVTINLTLRTRNEYGINKQFKKKGYHGGNFKFDKNDKYKRDTFSSKVLVRNLML
jgi:prepilin-type N-terminal cleavage/methylation domain-containing protein